MKHIIHVLIIAIISACILTAGCISSDESGSKPTPSQTIAQIQVPTPEQTHISDYTAVTTTIPTPVPTTKVPTSVPTSRPPTPAPTKVTIASSSGSSDIYISDLSLNKEWVKITNQGSTTNLQGWEVQDDDAKHTYTFSSYSLSSGATVTLHSGKGTDTSTDLYWGGKYVWNNDGDTAYLYDNSGKLISHKS